MKEQEYKEKVISMGIEMQNLIFRTEKLEDRINDYKLHLITIYGCLAIIIFIGFILN